MSKEDRRDVGRELLAEASERLRTIVGDAVDIRTHLAEAGIVASLLIASRKAALVVLRRRDLSAVERVFTGSISNAVAARSSCPVVIVPAGWDHATTHNRVVVGLDDTALSPEAIDFAFPTAQERKATLTALHAWRAPVLYDDIIFSRTSEHTWRDTTQRHLDQELAPWRERHPEVQCEVVVEYERPAQALSAASASSDLLVVGRRTRPLPRGLALGSVTRALVRACACPLVVTPHPEDADVTDDEL
ncbi:universal stress protein [Mumia sp. DW29H23]|uniref:universal stress protein n=1 Tax=Mumia sp. DW29H23 TaxID=3421241 RepID=UPI003D69F9C5